IAGSVLVVVREGLPRVVRALLRQPDLRLLRVPPVEQHRPPQHLGHLGLQGGAQAPGDLVPILGSLRPDAHLDQLVLPERVVQGRHDRVRQPLLADLHHGVEPVPQTPQVPPLLARQCAHSVNVSRCSPQTPRSTSLISPTVAPAFTAASVGGKRLSAPLAAASIRPSASAFSGVWCAARQARVRSTCSRSTRGSIFIAETTGASLTNSFCPTMTRFFSSTSSW